MRTPIIVGSAAVAAASGLIVAGVVVALSGSAKVHGALTQPMGRVHACFDDATGGGHGHDHALHPTNEACADALAEGGAHAFWNRHGNFVADPVGGHRESVTDGELCGPTEGFAAFNSARADWPATWLPPGKTVEFRHGVGDPGPGTFSTYVTTDGFDPESSLTWDELELIDETVDPPRHHWDVDLPERQGRHIVYVVWEPSNGSQVFYHCSDVVFGDGEEYCVAEYTVTTETDGRFEAEVEVTAGSDGVDGWMVDWVFANGQEILEMTGATWVAHGAHFEATGGALEAGESTTFTFTAAYEGVNVEPRVACQEPVDH